MKPKDDSLKRSLKPGNTSQAKKKKRERERGHKLLIREMIKELSLQIPWTLKG